MRDRRGLAAVIGGLGAALLLGGGALQAQDGGPLLVADDEVRPWGQGVAPVYEGWYEHPDGEGLVISFGYMNRNGEEVLDVPVGERNRVGAAEVNGLQPTHFLPRRQYGVFTVTVPEDFGRDEVVWTVNLRGEEFAIPGRVSNINYKIDAMYAPATGLTPPLLRFRASGEDGRGPHGIRSRPRRARVGQPLDLTVWTSDDTWTSEEMEPHTVTLRWYKYAGPGDVAFEERELPVEPRDGMGRTTTTATFDEPGDYVLYVRANNESLVGSGMEQCCWTNGYVDVTVTR